MKKILYYSLFLLLPLSFYAQTYSWQWAKAGGGDVGPSGTGISETQDELIRDVVIDNDNNSYHLTKIFPQNPNINGTPVTSYQNSDLLLFSLDCQGNLRWSRTIGGYGSNETAWKLSVDNSGGLYMMTYVVNEANTAFPATFLTIRWDDTHAMPAATTSDNTTPDPGLNTTFLLKYNTTNGNLVYAKPLQGAVSRSLRESDNSVWCMDSNKNIHAIIGFRAGSHLGGIITVPSSFTTELQYYLVKFNFDGGNMTPELNPILLPITGSVRPGLQGKVQMTYDRSLMRFYIAGSTSFTFNDFTPLSYGGTALSDDGYVLAIDGTNGNEVWRREFTTYFGGTTPSPSPDEKIYSLLKDSSGNLYMSGRYANSATPTPTFSGGSYSYNLPVTSQAVNQNFVMKLNSSGNVLWTKIPTSTDSSFFGAKSTRARITLNGNEVAFVKATRGLEMWDNFTITNPQNDLANSLLVRLNKDTGTTINVHPIKSDFGTEDELTSIAVDNDGNYVVGGYFSSQLFTDPNDGIPTISYGGSNKSQFYAAKLAKAPCSPLATEEISIKETDMQFYPNPVDDVLTIKTKVSLKTYEVISAVGQQVKRGSFKGNNYTINMQGLTKGVYFVKVSTDKISVVEKVIKK